MGPPTKHTVSFGGAFSKARILKPVPPLASGVFVPIVPLNTLRAFGRYSGDTMTLPNGVDCSGPKGGRTVVRYISTKYNLKCTT